MDGSESSGVKVARGHKIEDVRQRLQGEQELIARLRTANVRFSDAQTERIWAIVSAHQAGLSIRRTAGATGLSSNAQTLTYSYDDADQLLSVASSTPMETSRAAWASPLAGMPRIRISGVDLFSWIYFAITALIARVVINLRAEPVAGFALLTLRTDWFIYRKLLDREVSQAWIIFLGGVVPCPSRKPRRAVIAPVAPM